MRLDNPSHVYVLREFTARPIMIALGVSIIESSIMGQRRRVDGGCALCVVTRGRLRW